MRTIVDYLLRPQGNVEDIVMKILRDADARATRSVVMRKLHEHPSFPSLSAVSDVLWHYGIETLSLRVDDLDQIEPSRLFFLAQINYQERLLFALVYQRMQDSVDWYNPMKHRRETISLDSFREISTGYIMFVDASEKIDEKGYVRHRRADVVRQVIENSLVLSPLVLAVAGLFMLSTISLAVLTLLILVGVYTGMLLLLYEYNQHSPVVSKVCSTGKQTNCGGVLHSKASRFMGIPWSVIGTAYFYGLLLTLCLTGYNKAVVALAAFLHLPGLGYVGYSVYFQYRIVRQWCPLCLLVQAVIVAMFICFLAEGVYAHPSLISPTACFVLLCALFLSFATVFFLWLLSREHRLREHYRQEEQKIKYDRDVFQSLLLKSRRVELPPAGLGVMMGNPNGRIRVIEVCHPFCEHCSEALSVLHRIVDNNNDIFLQIIFASDPNDERYKELPIDMFLSLKREGADMEEVLASWYGMPKKSLEAFSKRYPVSNRYTEENGEEARMMMQFCKDTGIIGTPTIFINGHELPLDYRVEELLYCLQ